MNFTAYAYEASIVFFVLFSLLTLLSEWKWLSEKMRQELEVPHFFSFLLLAASIPVSIVGFIFDHQAEIYEFISHSWFIVVAVLAGPALFAFRCRSPRWYGLIELLASWAMIGVAITASNSPPTDGQLATNILSSGLPLVAKSTALLAGIYVSVRALDNINKDVPKVIEPQWRRCFPKGDIA